ncbi:OmpA family protein [Aureimonas leprariae]|uniref:OmpA family protein n=1 Tax=Plantimonas leprariae TaxID=2615207 RepID=A0A7V7PRJ5_9HYPH|nr:OmpA family protein [Aureimonas leprariae]KAB0681346.1 OmpA family protein [Aureimonas leprariae]
MDRSALAALGLLVSASGQGACLAADCRSSLAELRAALETADPSVAAAKLAALDPCGAAYVRQGQLAVAMLYVRQASPLTGNEARRPEYRMLVEKAAAYHASWEASWRLAELQRTARDYREAATSFQEAIDLLATDSSGSSTAEARKRRDEAATFLMRSADEMRSLAAGSPDGVRNGEFVAASTDRRDGSFAGVYNAAFERGLSAEKVPAPITFLFDSDRFDDVGRKAAAEIVELFKARRPSRIHVVGYTDQKGTAEYNVALSLRRARAVQALLQAELSRAGIDAAISSEGRGKVRRQLSDPSIYSAEQIDQLDRRVEFDWSR